MLLAGIRSAVRRNVRHTPSW